MKQLGRKSLWVIEDLDSIVNQLELIGIYGTFYQNIYLSQYIFFLNAHGTFTTLEDILGHKINLKNFKVIEGDTEHLL